ncbi:MAG: ABC transporter permease [Alphaproteobacteria bacterium]|nr:ABC transporter permease [Alphaproteobacteria bacterium SS10]
MRLFIQPLIQHPFLIWQLAKRDVTARYRGSVLGLLWSIGRPLLMLAVYTFVFSVVFEVRWNQPGIGDNRFTFAVVLFAGLIVHGLLADCLNRAPTLVLANANYVRKVVFPLDSLSYVLLISSLFHTAVSFLVLLGAYVIFIGVPPLTALLAPIALLPLIPLFLGLGWALAALGVFLRDIGEVTAIMTTILLFVSPIFFPIEQFPEELRFLLYYNPLTLIIESLRQVVLYGQQPDWLALGIYSIAALAFAQAGYWLFLKSRRGFSDVI